MRTDSHKLLVLKTFYLGRAISEKKTTKSQALDMIARAIAILEERADRKSRVRLLFYLLLEAEALRGSDAMYELREKAKAISSELDANIFEDYMLIEEITQTRKKAYGLHSGQISDQGVRSGMHVDWGFDGSRVWSVYSDDASRALGIDTECLSKKSFTF